MELSLVDLHPQSLAVAVAVALALALALARALALALARALALALALPLALPLTCTPQSEIATRAVAAPARGLRKWGAISRQCCCFSSMSPTSIGSA